MISQKTLPVKFQEFSAPEEKRHSADSPVTSAIKTQVEELNLKMPKKNSFFENQEISGKVLEIAEKKSILNLEKKSFFSKTEKIPKDEEFDFSKILNSDLPPNENAVDAIGKKLISIFSFYTKNPCGISKEQFLNSTKFKQFCEDANLVDKNLPLNRIDLIFHKIQKNSKFGLSKENFFEALVQISILKFPTLETSKAVFQLFLKNLRFFSENKKIQDFQISDDFLSCFEIAKENLQRIYSVYFPFELGKYFKENSLNSKSQNSFYQFLVDFEICPLIISKGFCFQIFREGIKFNLQNSVFEKIIFQQSEFFSFQKFIFSLLLLARKIFTLRKNETDGILFLRLLSKMDNSNGKLIFSTLRTQNQKINLIKFVPEEILNLIDKRQQEISNEKSREKTILENLKINYRPQTAKSSRQPIADKIHKISYNKITAKLVQLEDSIDSRCNKVISDLFVFYSCLGDPLSRNFLSSVKFSRFLRDCGFLKAKAQGAISFYVKGSKILNSEKVSEIVEKSKESKNEENRHKIVDSFLSLTKKKDLASSEELKKTGHVATSLELTQIDADLIFIQASQVSVRNNRRHHIDLVGFRHALLQIAHRLVEMNSELHSLQDVTQNAVLVALGCITEVVLAPLALSLENTVDDEGMSFSLLIAEEPKLMELLFTVRRSLTRIFNSYSIPNFARHKMIDQKKKILPAALDLKNFRKFCEDFNFVEKLTNLNLQRIFFDSAELEKSSVFYKKNEKIKNNDIAHFFRPQPKDEVFNNIVDNEQNTCLGFLGFQLALISIAKKTIQAPSSTTVKVVSLFKMMRYLWNHHLKGHVFSSTTLKMLEDSGETGPLFDCDFEKFEEKEKKGAEKDFVVLPVKKEEVKKPKLTKFLKEEDSLWKQVCNNWLKKN